MSKFKVWVFLYILIWAINLNVSYSDYETEVKINEKQICSEIDR